MKLSKIFDDLPIAVIILTFDCNFHYINEKAEKLLTSTFSLDIKKDMELNQFFKKNFKSFMAKIIKDKFIKEEQLQINENFSLKIDANLIVGEQLAIFYSTLSEKSENYSKNYNNLLADIIKIQIKDLETKLKIDEIFDLTIHSMDLDSIFIYEMESIITETKKTYGWLKKGSETKTISKEDSLTEFPITSKGICVYLSDHLDSHISQTLKNFNVITLAMTPIFSNKKQIGVLAFASRKKNKIWSEEELFTLEEISSIVSSLIVIEHSENLVEKSFDIMCTVLDNININIYVSDIETNEILFTNKQLKKSLSLTEDTSTEGEMCWKVIKKRTEGPCEDCPVSKLKELDKPNGLPSMRREIKNPISDLWYYTENSIITWIDGKKVHLETSVEFTDHKVYSEKLKLYASIDSLTQVYNRGWGYKYLQNELSTIAKNNSCLTVCFIDIDNLKITNDTYGHKSGDSLIVTVVKAVNKNIRKTDIIFRLAGDEFVLILPDCTAKQARMVISKINSALKEENNKNIYPFEISMSVGYEEVTSDNMLSAEEVISNADQKMYIEKIKRKKEQNFDEK